MSEVVREALDNELYSKEMDALWDAYDRGVMPRSKLRGAIRVAVDRALAATPEPEAGGLCVCCAASGCQDPATCRCSTDPQPTLDDDDPCRCQCHSADVGVLSCSPCCAALRALQGGE